ncbi:MAG: RNA methyltransferase [Hyphomonadaceae bacterium]|nr:RNA methyltransferase [Hyphomonadaceae bacterium]
MTRARDMPAPVTAPWPAICLVRPQMGENIGAVARVMLNFGLTGLRLVEPRDRWPNPKAFAVASGADQVLHDARLEWTLEDAIADATLVVAATARPRHMEKPVWGPRACAANLTAAIAAGEKPVILFGAEAMGLLSEDIARAEAIVTLPVNPGFASVNLATSVAIMAFALGEARQGADAPPWFVDSRDPPATHAELEGFFGHLEVELDHGRFFHPEDKAPLVRQNLRNLFLKARLTGQEVRTLRGVVKALVVGRGGRKKPGPGPAGDGGNQEP